MCLLPGPTEEFPGSIACISRDIKDGEAMDKDKVSLQQEKETKHELSEGETYSQREEAIKSAGSEPYSDPNSLSKLIKSKEQSKVKHDKAGRGMKKATGCKQVIDWGIVPMQRRKVYQRKLERDRSHKKVIVQEGYSSRSSRSSFNPASSPLRNYHVKTTTRGTQGGSR